MNSSTELISHWYILLLGFLNVHDCSSPVTFGAAYCECVIVCPHVAPTFTHRQSQLCTQHSLPFQKELGVQGFLQCSVNSQGSVPVAATVTIMCSTDEGYCKK